MKPFVKRFERNTRGRDFCVGDVHGHFSGLAKTMQSVGFSTARDRLFSVGDLVDRGPQSDMVLDWLREPWFHPVQGNHEDLAIRYVNPGHRDAAHYAMNGGAWLIGMTPYEQNEYALQLATLPYAIEVDTERGTVGIVHADVPGGSWRAMVEQFEAVDSRNKLKRVTDYCLWCRDRIEQENVAGVPDVRAVIVGHTPVRRPAILGNVYHIDTGGWLRDGYFTLIDLATLQMTTPPAEKLDWSDA